MCYVTFSCVYISACWVLDGPDAGQALVCVDTLHASVPVYVHRCVRRARVRAWVCACGRAHVCVRTCTRVCRPPGLKCKQTSANQTIQTTFTKPNQTEQKTEPSPNLNELHPNNPVIEPIPGPQVPRVNYTIMPGRMHAKDQPIPAKYSCFKLEKDGEFKALSLTELEALSLTVLEALSLTC